MPDATPGTSPQQAWRRLDVVLVSCGCAASLRDLLLEVARQQHVAAAERVVLSVRLILDQALDEAYRATFAAATAAGLTLRYRVTSSIGPPAARNVLIRWLLDEPPDAFVFLDDDEVPAENWLALLLQLWACHPGDILTGPLLARSTHQGFLLRHGVFGRLRGLKSGEVAPDAYIHNTLVPIEVARRLGPSFDTRLTICTGSDAAWFRSATRAGFTIRYFPELVVYETLTAEQQKLGIAVRRWIFNGRAGAIAGRLRRPGAGGWLRLAAYNAAKGAYGLLCLLGYALVLSPERSLRGLRVAMSATGGLLGLFSPLPQPYQAPAQVQESGVER